MERAGNRINYRMNKKDSIFFSFDLQLLSKYRAELMGFATILIILCHAIPNGVHLPRMIEKVMALGQTGVELFLFLSE